MHTQNRCTYVKKERISHRRKPVEGSLQKVGSTPATAAAGTCVAGRIADADLVIVAQRGRREQGQAEKFIIHMMLPLKRLREKLNTNMIDRVFVSEAAAGLGIDNLIEHSEKQGIPISRRKIGRVGLKECFKLR